MELEQIIKRMIEFESLIDPQEMVVLSSHISEFLTDFELQYDEAKLAYSMAWEEMKYGVKGLEYEKPLSDKVTEVRMMRSEQYKNLMRIKRTLGELKRYRSDLNRKLDVQLGIKRRT